jgi:precorrin-6B methylase 1
VQYKVGATGVRLSILDNLSRSDSTRLNSELECLEESDKLRDANVLARKNVEELCMINVGIISPQLQFFAWIA